MVNVEPVFKNSFVNLLQEGLEEHGIMVDEFARGWVDQQAASGDITVPRYLDAFSYELRQTLHASSRNYDTRTEYFNLIIEPIEDRDPNSLVSRMVRAKTPLQKQRLYEAEHDKYDIELGLPFVVYFNALSEMLTLRQKARSDPEPIVEKIHGLDIEPSLRQVLHTQIDWQIFLGAYYDRDVASMYKKTSFASSEAARIAMNAALDEKLLRWTLKGDKSRYDPSIILEHSSSSAAREAMLGYLAARASGARMQSTGMYDRRITDDFFKDLRRQREERLKEKLRAEQEERRRRWEREDAEREERQRKWREREEEFFDKLRIKRPMADGGVDSIIALVPDYKYQAMLRRAEPSIIERVIGRVKELRKADPDITPRGVYIHFYRPAHMNDATDEQRADLHILEYLLAGDKSKTATLPF